MLAAPIVAEEILAARLHLCQRRGTYTGVAPISIAVSRRFAAAPGPGSGWRAIGSAAGMALRAPSQTHCIIRKNSA